MNQVELPFLSILWNVVGVKRTLKIYSRPIRAIRINLAVCYNWIRDTNQQSENSNCLREHFCNRVTNRRILLAWNRLCLPDLSDRDGMVFRRGAPSLCRQATGGLPGFKDVAGQSCRHCDGCPGVQDSRRCPLTYRFCGGPLLTTRLSRCQSDCDRTQMTGLVIRHL